MTTRHVRVAFAYKLRRQNTIAMEKHHDCGTGGRHNLKLVNHRSYYDLRKYFLLHH